MDAQVWSVDARRGRLQLRSRQGGTNTVHVDRATRVVYRERSYPVDALERGDVVRLWIEIDPRGYAWADRVEVRRSARERFGDRSRDDDRSESRVAQLEGRVGEVSLGNGYFTLQQGSDQTVAVYFPDGLDRKERKRVERLRRGDRVRAEVRLVSRTEAELVRIR